MTHQSPKTHRDPPEPRLLDDGFLDDEFRAPFTGWALDEPPPVAPITRRAAFVGFVVCVAVVAAVVVLLLATPRTAGHVIPAADRLVPPRDDGWSVSGNLDRLSGAPHAVAWQVGAGIETRPLQRPGDSGLGRADVSAEARQARDLSRRQLVPKLPSTTGGGAPQSGGAVGTVLIGGTLSYVDAKYGPSYLALPFPRGTVAEICGPGGCVTRRSTDYGPDQRVHPDRIADLSAADFVYVCGVPLSAGLCRGTVEIEPPVDPDDDRMRVEDGGPRPTTPATDATP